MTKDFMDEVTECMDYEEIIKNDCFEEEDVGLVSGETDDTA